MVFDIYDFFIYFLVEYGIIFEKRYFFFYFFYGVGGNGVDWENFGWMSYVMDNFICLKYIFLIVVVIFFFYNFDVLGGKFIYGNRFYSVFIFFVFYVCENFEKYFFFWVE